MEEWSREAAGLLSENPVQEQSFRGGFQDSLITHHHSKSTCPCMHVGITCRLI